MSVLEGSLESYSPLSVVRDGSSQMSLRSDGVTKFINEDGVSWRGWTGELWENISPRCENSGLLTTGTASITLDVE